MHLCLLCACSNMHRKRWLLFSLFLFVSICICMHASLTAMFGEDVWSNIFRVLCVLSRFYAAGTYRWASAECITTCRTARNTTSTAVSTEDSTITAAVHGRIANRCAATAAATTATFFYLLCSHIVTTTNGASMVVEKKTQQKLSSFCLFVATSFAVERFYIVNIFSSFFCFQ